MQTPEDALEEAQRAAVQGALRFTRHAREQMSERQAREHDVRQAVLTATTALPNHGDQGKEDKWKLHGADTDGDDLTVVVSFDAGYPRVVTVF